ncbi:MAG: hypothetical protein HY052_07725 [Proteobacteria bacterium]|nr:hypothetical protein [Pseudomonadota bacterium]
MKRLVAWVSRTRSLPRPENPERGNVLLMVLIGIVLLAALTAVISQFTGQQSDSLSQQKMDDEIARMLAQTSALGGALNQMIVNGENADTLYQAPPIGLNTVIPGAAGYETAPHNLKIYHPLGGGVSYMSSSANVASPLAFGFKINSGAIVTGVGATDAVVGDVVFVAQVSSEAACQRINTVVAGSSAVPVLLTADFNKLFVAGTAVTIGADCTPSCANTPRMCVSNTDATAWGFYSALLPG